jgi:hypothetical protein
MSENQLVVPKTGALLSTADIDLIQFSSPNPVASLNNPSVIQSSLTNTEIKNSKKINKNLLDSTLSSTENSMLSTNISSPTILITQASDPNANTTPDTNANEMNSALYIENVSPLPPDIIDFSQDISEDLNDQDDNWLCDPKKQLANMTQNSPGTKNSNNNHTKNSSFVLNDIKNNQFEIDDLNNNNKRNRNNNNGEQKDSENSEKKANQTNPYKWIMQEFEEDKSLDKVKRTLLVTLDDISKGYSNSP